MKMTKILNWCLVVFMASALMIACDKEPIEDEPIVDDTTGATQDSEDPIPENTVKVTFGDDEWVAEYVVPALQMLEGDSVVQILAQRDQDADLDKTHIVRIAGLPRIGVETATASYENNEITAPSFSNSSIYACDYFDNGYIANQSGNIYGNWWGKEMEWKITSFDPTSMKIQVYMTAVMFDANAVLVDEVPFEEAIIKNMKVGANVTLVNK